MADYIDYTGQQFDTFKVERPANVTDVCRRQDKTRKITEWITRKNRDKECVFISRSKYWYCVCCVCKKINIVRSDHLSEKICRCQKKKT